MPSAPAGSGGAGMPSAPEGGVTPVFFVAGGTGISAETLGNLMLQQFPSLTFSRRKIPFIKTVEHMRRVVAEIDAAHTDEVTPLVFSTVSDEELRKELLRTTCAVIDLFGPPLDDVERVLHVNATHGGTDSLHGVGDTSRYDARMKAIEYAMEHDDGASLRNLEGADLILVAPSRCGKTPTSMYLALQHGLKVANYPLVEEDFETAELPRPIRELSDRCFGLLSTAARLSQVRGERRPGSRYASLAQCSYELRRAEALYRAHRIPSINSAKMSVEEMAAVIMQSAHLSRLSS
ncbi:hypothetical protein BCF74_11021 [Knoellia remsis]|uniref:Putative phosphoenolpyruvate synthase regulatory protein n=2 Tax=Knoellia remsis TaxID=407159 RepID=A0A2T0UN06_9MICO|nr:hypothetical protein BCF74_11021 [Knoellia remsis]